MGYTTIIGSTIADVIERVTRDQNHTDGTIQKTLKSARRGESLWLVAAKYKDDVEVDRYILHYILGHDSDGAGYRDESESTGPYLHTCPLAFFELVPEPPNEHAKRFREKCIAAQDEGKARAREIKALVPGDRIALPATRCKGVHEFEFIRLHASSIVARGTDGVIYRLRPRTHALATFIKSTPPPPAHTPMPENLALPLTIERQLAS